MCISLMCHKALRKGGIVMNFSAVNTVWLLIGTVLIFFMQAGFCMLEAGLTRAKSAGNIVMKNIVDFCIGSVVFWAIGFGIMYGSSNGFFGKFDFFTQGNYSAILPAGIPFFVFFIFQTVFCGTSATIVSGAMAERTTFKGYCLASLAISLLVYPMTGHWIWGNGWLSNMGFHDFAGSCAVHMVGGLGAFLGAFFLGPRIGKYDKNKKSRAIPGHNLTLAALGIFILWFCWFGFNGSSTTSIEGITTAADGSKLWFGALAGKVLANTNIAACASTLTALFFTWFRYRKPDVSMTLNGSLAGLVVVTANSDCVAMPIAALEGVIAGFAVVLAVEFIDNKLKVDDPVGAVGAHFVCGIIGTLSVGLFSTGQNGVGKGLFYGGGFKQLGIQLLGILAVCIYVTIVMSIVFIIIKKTVGLRVSAKTEIEGLDNGEHGLASAYAGFEFNSSSLSESALYDDIDSLDIEAIGSEAVDKAVPAFIQNSSLPEDKKITKIQVLMKESKFERFKKAMNDIGVMGMTVTHVLGCGTQKGATEYYRGVEMEMHLLPKIQVDIVVSKVPVMDVINATRKALYTGHIGDGKIFVYDVEDVVKVRTGETGYTALQGADE